MGTADFKEGQTMAGDEGEKKERRKKDKTERSKKSSEKRERSGDKKDKTKRKKRQEKTKEIEAELADSGDEGDAPITVFAEKYTVGEILGRGAFSTVKEVTSKRSGRKYAVKIIDKKNVGQDMQ